MIDVPVFLVTGFLESGKTTFIKEIFNDPDFTEGEKIAVITCESGIEEYEKEVLNKNNAVLIQIKNKEELTSEFLNQCKVQYKPTKVIIEYNGMWQFDLIENLDFPKGWELVQIMTTIDATTFDAYMSNMKSLMIEQFKDLDLIVVNRCKENTNKLAVRNSIKAVSGKANIVFELENGEIDDTPLELPFDINAPIIEFEDYDYGVWYLDAIETPEKYDGKHIKVKGLAYTHDQYPKNVFAFGRRAMTCCADDISFLGLLCQSGKPVDFDGQKWIELEGVIHKQYVKEEQREIPFLMVKSYKEIEKIENDLVYF